MPAGALNTGWAKTALVNQEKLKFSTETGKSSILLEKTDG
jgi:hypothetical protein